MRAWIVLSLIGCGVGNVKKDLGDDLSVCVAEQSCSCPAGGSGQLTCDDDGGSICQGCPSDSDGGLP
jgi:hypothetical protein